MRTCWDVCCRLSDRGERELVAAIGDYEAEMREYGAAAVRYSLEQKDQALRDGRRGKGRRPRLLPTLPTRACATPARLRKAWLGPAEPYVWEHRAV